MNRNLYTILTIGLIISLVFMIAGFVFGILNNANEGNIIETSEYDLVGEIIKCGWRREH
jgi:uncharacterized membrane protein